MTEPSKQAELTILKMNNYLQKGEQQYTLSVAYHFGLMWKLQQVS